MLPYLNTSIGHEEWKVITLPASEDITQLKCEGKTIFAHASSGQRAISNDFGATWKLYRERRKFRRHKKR